MLSKNFNKIGGTEFRVENQILGYLSVIEWILKKQSDVEGTSISDSE
jgi:hypothetical protein